MSFHVGQKVVCVDGAPMPGTDFAPETSPVRIGQVYEVRAVGNTANGRAGIKVVGARLSGPFGVITGGPFTDVCWSAARFRPLIERKTDISIFTEMLTPNVKQREAIGT